MQKIISLLTVLLFSISSFSQEKLEEVKVNKTKKGIQKSLTIATNTSVVTSQELLKAACCNLAESFETNPTIDVNFSDALTGTKQIKMLGLTSQYLTINRESVPLIRGAAQQYGLSFTPGTWIESIQITKGAGSVINGFESISGQINTELIKPITNIPFFLNAYTSSDYRVEINTHFNKKITKNWASALFVHGSMIDKKNDLNRDGFLDNPLSKQVNILNRWQYSNHENGIVFFANGNYVTDKKQIGQVNFDPIFDKGTTRFWGSEIKTEKVDFSSKIAYVWKEMPFQSIGFHSSINSHNQQSYFGLKPYNVKQNSFFANLIFNSIIENTMNKFSVGLNVIHDDFKEDYLAIDYGRKDTNIGSFFEYTYDNASNFCLILGVRADNHNRLGMFFTPRLHLRYNPWESSVVRFSAGQGRRVANVFSENQNLFNSSRTFNLPQNINFAYGLNPEIAWNYGLSFSQKFSLFDKNADIGLDYYRTDFQNQVIVDLYTSHQQIYINNLNGKSFANSLQFDFNIELKKHLDLRMAYKFYDIQSDYISGRFQKPLQAAHRFFLNIGYMTHIIEGGKQWKFDVTTNWIDKQKMPNTNNHFQEFSPSFYLLNSQITRTFSSFFEIYFGGENITNLVQKQAIVDYENPFGSNFDASVVYAPVFGQTYYFGLRYKIKN